MNKKILIIEDEVAIQDILKNYLEDVGYVVETADDGMEGYSKFQRGAFDLILLDIMMPKIDGYVVLEMIRKESNVPVMMITAMGDVVDQVKAFELKVDDYITKPFDMKLVLVRVAAMLRRSVASERGAQEEESKIKYRDLVMDMQGMEVFEQGSKLELTHKEFEILRLLLENQNRVFTREMLLEKLWDYDYFGNPKVVNVHIQNLRKKLVGNYIETVRGVGYKIAKED
jgi:two-component system response regulator VanR